MLRLIAYGDELNLAHPPRPKDPKVKWEPVWAVKMRVKAVTNGALGMADAGMPGASAERSDARREESRPAAEGTQGIPGIPQPMELLKGLFGR